VSGAESGTGPAFFPALLERQSLHWYENHNDDTEGYFDALRDSFTAYVVPSAVESILKAQNVFNRLQQGDESVRDYVQTMLLLTKNRRVPGSTYYVGFLVIEGFKLYIKGYVQQREHCHILDEVMETARLTEVTSAKATKEMSTLTQ
jgi:hypothetical protein